MKNSIVFLGPEGATFSYDAYEKLSDLYSVPKLFNNESIPVKTNSLILPTLLTLEHAYGVIAMETKAEGRVAEPVESFIELLSTCPLECPIKIIGAIKMNIHFCLMIRKDLDEKDIQGIVAHPKALGACKEHIKSNSNWNIEESTSNGKAAQDVAELSQYASYAALGPASAAKKYNLKILNPEFEDQQATTTFFLLGPKESVSKVEETNRALIIFSVKDTPGALLHALQPFEEHHINLIQIHSVHVKDGKYDFAIEIECNRNQIEEFNKAVEIFMQVTSKSFVFGPFAVKS